ncbi:C-type lectin BfL-2-like isoform X2 [Mercenaria mercenaria]|uniref:C-type lectin BfL-2-like isoform X2 n=1 Tax=Mercenaria mercenaria TaxID=6596 RepID=UPI00234F8DAA|nr:C-type lectin BfL-2-like isoform X2 [Mercenaria mercenaria]
MKLTVFFAVIILAYALACFAYPAKISKGKKAGPAKAKNVKRSTSKRSASEEENLETCTTDAQCPPGTICLEVSSSESKSSEVSSSESEMGHSGRKCYPYSTAEGPCPPGWILNSGSCYLFSSTSKTWIDAVADCNATGGYLVETNDGGEFEFVRDYYIDVYAFWIGLNDRTTEGTYAWSRSGSIVSYYNFSSNGNYNSEDYDCVFIVYDYMYFTNCGLFKKYICEMEATGDV